MPRPLHVPLAVLVASLAAASACHTDPAAPPAPTMSPAPAATHELTPIGDLLWHTDYDAAVEVARAEGKPLWVHFGEDPG